MPTYVYKCHQCGHRFDAFQKISADPLTECPSCQNASSLQRVPSGGGFQLQGSGWYDQGYSSISPISTSETNSSSCCPCGKNTPGACKSSS